jgi:hypothetical protein
MSSSPESQISLEDFRRHFVLTHMKERATGVFAEVAQEAELSGKSVGCVLAQRIHREYSQGGYQDDKWYAREIPLDFCYFAHTDFRLRPVPKNKRFVDFLSTRRKEIDSGAFPCSLEIRARWSGPMPEPLAQEREANRYYILGGQLRVIRHWYHDMDGVRVFVYRGLSNI